ncbi:MAG: peptidoglycan editing factor PgeF [Candidatus Neomarinimicrobiota bacterium]|nr:MAG: peptidoglycan editing factor PgeF [Candidatus Neomarinimicrobiota bacterium]
MRTGFVRRKFGELEVLSVMVMDSFPGVFHVFGVKQRSRSAGMREKEFFLINLGLDPGSFAEVEQVHGSKVVVVSNPGVHGEADGLITVERGLVLGVKTADCVPLLFYDRVTGVIAAIHAGWRGLARGIIESAFKEMNVLFGVKARDVVVAVGPFIRSCCYRIGDEVGEFFMEDEIVRRNGSLFLDMEKSVLNRLIGAGVEDSNIGVIQLCTFCEDDMFHSYRREGEAAGRMYSLIVKR